MSFEKFSQVIEELSVEFGFPNPLLEDALCDIEIEGIHFTLLHTLNEDDKLTSACDFGEAPEEQSAEILRRVLEANMVWFGSDMPRFVINPQTGRVVLMASIPLEGLTADELVDILRQHGNLAREWRITYFLGLDTVEIIARQVAETQEIIRLERLDEKALAMASAA